MRVLHIGKFYYPHKGGMERHLKDLCEGLNGWCELKAIVANSCSAKTEIGSVNGVNIVRAGCLGGVSSTSVCPSMPYWIGKFKADIVHLHFPNPIAHISWMIAGKCKKLVITWHSDIVRQKTLLKLYNPFLNNILKRADRIIATSENYINTSTYLNRYRNKCSVIPLGLDISRFNKTPSVEKEIKGIKDLYGNRPLILFVGRFAGYKGLKFLVEAMASVQNGYLLIIGDGEEYSNIKSIINKKGLQEKVFIHKDVSDDLIPAFYHACNIFVLPSIMRSEAFGVVQLEAMACSKPVISTDIKTGVSFVNLHKRTGIVVPPEDPYALSLAINELLADKNRQRIYGEYGFERVKKEFSLKKMVEETKNIYINLLNQN